MSIADRLHAQMPPASPVAPHLVIEALAGTGKTTTLVEGLKVLQGQEPRITPSPQQKAVWDSLALSRGASSVAFCAFNSSIAKELKDRVPAGVDAMTMHSMGNRAVYNAFGRLEVTEWRVDDIIADILGANIKDLRRQQFEVLQATKKLVSLCKMNLVGVDNDNVEGDAIDAEGFNDLLDQLASHYGIDFDGKHRTAIYSLVPKVLDKCKDPQHDRRIDFDDQIWLPVVLGLPLKQYDVLLVDECQDLNRCQQALAKRAGKRLVLCGDKQQAIYGFAGADARSMERMIEELGSQPEPNSLLWAGAAFRAGYDSDNPPPADWKAGPGCVVLPLTVTRRCGRAIVEEAKKIVPHFEAHESNSDGFIDSGRYDNKGEDGKENPAIVTYHPRVADGDMILCRVNAPLVSQCFRFLKAGRKANIQGKDVGRGLTSTISKMERAGAKTVAELIEKLDEWTHSETEKELAKRNPSDARLMMLNDRFECILMFTDGMNSIQEVVDRIERVFTDNRTSPGIKLSSIHKAKGLEARRVFLLEPPGATVPHPAAKTAWQKVQEWNLRYVAITRAIEELVYVS